MRVGAVILGFLVVAQLVDGAGDPGGFPPAAYNGDPIPTPLRTLWVDRCGRGNAGTCGSVTCSDANAGTSKNAPLCTLGSAAAKAIAGDQIEVRAGATPGNGGVDGYWEVDTHGGQWGTSTMAPSTKGTARCAAGTKANWNCHSDADCPSSTCVYHPIVLHGFVEAGGAVAEINPNGC